MRHCVLAGYVILVSISLLLCLATFCVNKIYLPNARDTMGYCDIPMGKEMYLYLVKKNTTLINLSIPFIHKLGLSETAKVLQQMEATVKTLQIKDFSNNKQFYLVTRDQIIDKYNETKQYIEKQILPKYFGDLRPSNDYKIKAVPKYTEEFNTVAYYMQPSRDNKRKGTFYANLHNMKEHPTYQMEVLTLHEGCPGHHYQIDLSQNNKSIPKFRRFDMEMYNSYIEGWGLYCETLGEYKDGYSLMGKYNYDSMRCARLVLDTGIHYYGWTAEKAIQYLSDVTSLTESEIASEVYRYISWPGQALSYKLGQLEILKGKKIYLEKNNHLDSVDNNIIRFHKKLMEIGPIPLWLLETALTK